jgi:hypothetical protein
MKKLLVSTFLSLFAFTAASAEVGVNVGVSGQIGLFAASATETDVGTRLTTSGSDEKNNAADHIAIGYASIFVEKDLGDRITIGVDYVPDSLDSETSESIRYDATTGAVSAKENKVQASFEDLTTVYVNLNITENFYVKAGYSTVDIITNESLATGSTYGNTDTSGTLLGFGSNMNLDNGIFIRAEATYTQYDGVKLTSQTNSSNSVAVDSLDGVSGKLSIGKSF